MQRSNSGLAARAATTRERSSSSSQLQANGSRADLHSVSPLYSPSPTSPDSAARTNIPRSSSLRGSVHRNSRLGSVPTSLNFIDRSASSPMLSYTLPDTNMNPSNLAFLQAMPMTSMPVHAQPPLQTVARPPTVPGHVLPQQTAFPTFFFQAPQLQTVPGPLSVPQIGGQPWALPTLQTLHPTQHSAFHSTAAAPTMTHVAAPTNSSTQDPVRDKLIPVGSALDDERILVNTLRKAQAEGLTPLQGFGALDKVSTSDNVNCVQKSV